MREPENPVLASLIRAFDEPTRQSFFERVDQVLAEQKRVYPVEAEAMVFIEMRAAARSDRDRGHATAEHAGTATGARA
jgi:hypothetical protein